MDLEKLEFSNQPFEVCLIVYDCASVVRAWKWGGHYAEHAAQWNNECRCKFSPWALEKVKAPSREQLSSSLLSTFACWPLFDLFLVNKEKRSSKFISSQIFTGMSVFECCQYCRYRYCECTNNLLPWRNTGKSGKRLNTVLTIDIIVTRIFVANLHVIFDKKCRIQNCCFPCTVNREFQLAACTGTLLRMCTGMNARAWRGPPVSETSSPYWNECAHSQSGLASHGMLKLSINTLGRMQGSIE